MSSNCAQFHIHQQIQFCCVILGKSLSFPWKFLNLQNVNVLPHKGVVKYNKLKNITNPKCNCTIKKGN